MAETVGIFVTLAGLILSWLYGMPTGAFRGEEPRNLTLGRVGGLLVVAGLALTVPRLFAG